MAKSLVIVESPAKAKTIDRILKGAYIIRSSMGHIIDLPATVMGVDLENNFEPTYRIIKGRKKIVQEIKKNAKSSDAVYLATDPDREGEAIAWHLKNQVGNDQKFLRVEFHEITEQAVKDAFKHPKDIDPNKVEAQIARRILDRIVGYNGMATSDPTTAAVPWANHEGVPPGGFDIEHNGTTIKPQTARPRPDGPGLAPPARSRRHDSLNRSWHGRAWSQYFIDTEVQR